MFFGFSRGRENPLVGEDEIRHSGAEGKGERMFFMGREIPPHEKMHLPSAEEIAL
jgi:hypothetical protein